MTWSSFCWQELDHARLLKVAIQGKKLLGRPYLFYINGSLYLRECGNIGYEDEAMGYPLDEVGPKDTLIVGKKPFLSSSSREHKLLVHVTTAGRTRKIIFRYVKTAPGHSVVLDRGVHALRYAP